MPEDSSKDPGFINSLIGALKPREGSPIPQAWLDQMLALTKEQPKVLGNVIAAVTSSAKSVINELTLNRQALDTLNKSVGPNLQATLIESYKKFDKDVREKDEDKKYKDRKKTADNDTENNQKKLIDTLTKNLTPVSVTKTAAIGAEPGSVTKTADDAENNQKKLIDTLTKNLTPVSVTKTVVPGADLEGAAAAEAALKEIPVQPVAIVEIKSSVLTALQSVILNALTTLKPAKKETTAGKVDGAAATKATSNSNFGSSLASFGKNFGLFLEGMSVGFSALFKSLGSLANPQVAIGLGLVVLAINGIALALRIAAPAIAAAMPFFVRIADVLGEVLKSAIKEIPNMIVAVGTAIGTAIKIAGPVLLELARIIGTVLVTAIEKIGPIVIGLAKVIGPVLVDIGRIIKETVVDTLKALTPIVQAITPVISELGRIIGTILVKAFDTVGPILMGLIPVIKDLIMYLGTGLVEAIKFVGPFLLQIGDVAKTLAVAIKDVVNGIIDTGKQILSVFGNVVSDISKMFTAGMDGITKIVDTIGGTIVKTVTTIKDTILGVIDGVTGSIERIAKIDGSGMFETAKGIAAVSAAMIAFGAGGAAAGVGSAIGSFFSKTAGSKSPIDQLLALGEQSGALEKLASTISTLQDSLSKFSEIKINIDPLEMFINTINKVDLAKVLAVTAALAVSPVLNAKANPIEQDQVTTQSQIAEVSTKTSTVDEEQTQPIPEVVGPAASIESPVVQTEQGPAVPVSIVPAQLAIPTTKQTGLDNVESTTTTPDTESDNFSQYSEGLERVAGRLEELIRAIGPLIAQNSGKSASNNTQTTISNVSSNTNNNVSGDSASSNRDIPYIERSKYRQNLLYSRGLL
jgi:phage-related protein